MESLRSKSFVNTVRRVQSDLAEMLQTHIAAPRAQMNHIVKIIGQLVVEALNDPDHQITEELSLFDEAQNKTAVEATEDVHTTGNGGMPARQAADRRPASLELVLNPQPTVTNNLLRRFWRLQLLLRVAAASPSRSKLAKLLNSSDGEVESVLKTLHGRAISQTSTLGWDGNLYSPLQRIQFIHDACDLLGRHISRPVPRLAGKQLIIGSEALKLSQREADLLGILMASPGTSIPIKDIEAKGVPSPVDTMYRLQKKLCDETEILLRTIDGCYCYSLKDEPDHP